MFLGRGERWQRAAAGPGGLMRACVLFMYVPSRRTCVVVGRSHHVAKEGIGCTLQRSAAVVDSTVVRYRQSWRRRAVLSGRCGQV
eukprot:2203631-Prymnesium_polylepis.1